MRAVLAFLAVLAASPALAQTFPMRVPDYCRMGECVRSRFLERVQVARNAEGVLYRVPVERSAGRPGRLRREPGFEVFAFCSRTRPTYMFRMRDEPRGSWVAHILSPGHEAGVAGYNTPSHADYNAICHGVPVALGPRAQALARRHGYTADLVDRARQIELARPQDILQRR